MTRREFSSAPPLEPEELVAALRSGHLVGDHAFDRFMPFELQEVSEQFWSSLAVARTSGRWFAELGVESVVDVGSGAGKFCVVAALVCGARFVGVEQRAHLVRSARDLARRFGVADRVEFVHATFGAAPLPLAGAYYFFNPFGENLLATACRIDSSVELGESRHLRDVGAAERFFENMLGGTLLLTYNGFGGELPDGFEPVRVNRALPSTLSLWRRR